MKKNIHANYEITETQKISDKLEVVLGRCLSSFDGACWYHNIEEDTYYDGEYRKHYYEAKEVFDKRVNGEKVNTPFTPGDVFDEMIAWLDQKNLLPDGLSDWNGFLDYALATRHNSENKTYLKTSNFWLECSLDYGSSEGIYIDVYLVLNNGETNSRISAGTIKTLEDDREAMYKMAKLQADILIEDYNWRCANRNRLDKEEQKKIKEETK